MNRIHLHLVTQAFYRTPWAITPEMHDVIHGILLERSEGGKPDASEIHARIDGKTYGSTGASDAGEVAVVNLHGVLMSRIQAMESISGGSTPQRFAKLVRDAANDPSVSTIVLSIDSPGGAVSGIGVAAQAVADAAAKKRVIAVIDDMACSAAYWIAAQATEIVIPESGVVGSISVIMAHLDRTKQLQQAGIKPTVLRTGVNKALGQSVEPLTADVRDKLMADMQKYHDLFVQAVATGRGRTPEDVQANWADGSTWIGQAAVTAGLADRLGTLQSVLDELTGQTSDDTTQDEQDVLFVQQPGPGFSDLDAAGQLQLLATIRDATLTNPEQLNVPEVLRTLEWRAAQVADTEGRDAFLRTLTPLQALAATSPPAVPPDPGVQTPPAARDTTPATPPASKEDHMNINAITAKLAAGQPLTAEERAFLNAHLDQQTSTASVNVDALPADARAAIEAMQRQLADTNARAEAAEKLAASERNTRLEREYRERALALGQPAEFGATLRALHETNPDAAADVESRLRAANAQVNLTRTFGGNNVIVNGTTAAATIEARARELEAKGVNSDEALEQAMRENTTAASEYTKEVRA